MVVGHPGQEDSSGTVHWCTHIGPSPTAAVDKKGDVLLWGNGFNVSSTPSAPRLSLQHHDIIKLLPTATKLFCLSRDGNVYVIPSDLEKQRANERDRQSNAAWWKVWASRDPGTDVEQLKPDSPLTRGEK